MLEYRKSAIVTAMKNNRRKKILTLCIVYKHPMILLGMKKRGFGAGRWNGFGGKVEAGETVEEAAVREMKEETGVIPMGVERRGVLEFEFEKNPEVLEVHVFKSNGVQGTARESEEMKPHWFTINEIPFSKMWPDDKHWLPLFLQNKRFRGRFLFDSADRILEMTVEEVLNI